MVPRLSSRIAASAIIIHLRLSEPKKERNAESQFIATFISLGASGIFTVVA